MDLIKDSYISYLNLEKRPDRRSHIESELKRIGIKAERTVGKLPHEFDLQDPKLQVMKNRTAGAIGCHYGQVEIMQKALEKGKNALVMEDDCILASDFMKRLPIIENFLEDKDWVFFFGGGTYHANNPAWWHKQGHSSDIPQCRCKLGIDAEKTDNKYIVRTYGAFSTHFYWVNHKYIADVLDFLETNVHLSMGIDFLTILLQPYIKAYAFIPGMVKQMDNQSNIGNGMTIFSGFSRLGSHWFQDSMKSFDYDNFKL